MDLPVLLKSSYPFSLLCSASFSCSILSCSLALSLASFLACSNESLHTLVLGSLSCSVSSSTTSSSSSIFSTISSVIFSVVSSLVVSANNVSVVSSSATSTTSSLTVSPVKTVPKMFEIESKAPKSSSVISMPKSVKTSVKGKLLSF